MKRLLVFALMGPVLAVIAAWTIVTVAIGGYFDPYGIPIVFLFSLIVCAVTDPLTASWPMGCPFG